GGAGAKGRGAGRGASAVPTIAPAANPPISPAATSPLPACAGCAAASAEMLMAVTRPAMAFFIVALLKSREPMQVARLLLVIEVSPNSLIECLGLKIPCAASLAVAVATTSYLKPEAGLLLPVNELRFARWVRQGGRNAFNRDWGYCCGWAFARNHATDPIGAGERRSH